MADVGEDDAHVAVERQSESPSQNQIASAARWTPGKTELRSEVVAIGVIQLIGRFHSSGASTRKVVNAGKAPGRRSTTKNIIGHEIVGLRKRRKVLPAQSQREREIGTHFPGVLREGRVVACPEVA